MSLTPEQIAVRKTRVGASEIGALVDYYAPRADGERVDPYKTAFDVWAHKDAPVTETADHQQWGNDVEEAILTFWTRQQGMTLVRGIPTLTHQTLAAVCATPDGFGVKGSKSRNLQGKNAQFHQMRAWGEEGSDNVPLLYVGQTNIELGILLAHAKEGKLGDFEEESDVVACLGGAPPKGFPVRFDPELFGNLVTLAEKFRRDHLETGKPPEVTLHSADSAAEWIRRKYPQQAGPMLDPTDELRTLVEVVRSSRSIGSVAEEEKALAEAKLKLLLKDAEGIHGLATFRKNKDSIGPDWEKIARHFAARAGTPSALDACIKLAEFQATKIGARVLRLTENTEPKAKGKRHAA